MFRKDEASEEGKTKLTTSKNEVDVETNDSDDPDLSNFEENKQTSGWNKQEREANAMRSLLTRFLLLTATKAEIRRNIWQKIVGISGKRRKEKKKNELCSTRLKPLRAPSAADRYYSTHARAY